MADGSSRRCRRSHAWRREYWRGHVAAQAESGLVIEDYCIAHGLKRRNFQRWRRRFKDELGGPAGAGRESAVVPEAAFAEVVVVGREAPEAGPAIEVVLRGDRRLRVAAGFEEETLQRLVTLLESLPC